LDPAFFISSIKKGVIEEDDLQLRSGPLPWCA